MKTLQQTKETILKRGEEIASLQKRYNNEPCRMCGLNARYLHEFISQSLNRLEKATREETIKACKDTINRKLASSDGNVTWVNFHIDDFDKLTSQTEKEEK